MYGQNIPNNPYLLLTPGPLSTSRSVKAAMLCDWCTWDKDYNDIVQEIRAALVGFAVRESGYTAALMQGSGTFSVESVITSAIPAGGKLLVLSNGAYGRRIDKIAAKAGIDHIMQDSGELSLPDMELLNQTLTEDRAISHVAVVHCETTTGILNPIDAIGAVVAQHNRVYIIDAMSSFGGIPMDMAEIKADFLISSANKCIQGVPGFGFVIARQEAMEACRNNARSLSLDLYDQWQTMEAHSGKWRFTSPTHVVRAFHQALAELDEEGGITVRHRRYQANHETLVFGMEKLGFACLIEKQYQSPIITAFYNPEAPAYDFPRFYGALKEKGYVIYPGKVSDHDTFRIGTIGEVSPNQIDGLLQAVADSMFWV